MIGVYKITNIQTGKFYIGSSINIEKRWREHKLALKKNKHHNPYLQRVWNKYGEHGFEFSVLEICSIEEILNREQYYLDLLLPNYNLCKSAGNTRGRLHTKLAKLKMSISRKGNTYSLGYKHNEVARKNMSEARKLQYILHPVGEETRRKLSLINRGRPKSDETKKKLSLARMGVKATEETRKKMSESRMGRPPTRGNTGNTTSDETKKKQSEARRLWWRNKKNAP